MDYSSFSEEEDEEWKEDIGYLIKRAPGQRNFICTYLT